MPAIEVRSIAALPVERWRNGGGVTRTIASDASGESQWRISLAEVERNGPYSRFEGIDRISLVLRGAGVTLRDERSTVQLRPFEAAGYDGDAQWNATLVDGPVTVLNAMTSRGRYRARIRNILEPLTVQSGCLVAVVALHGGCAWSDAEGAVSGAIEAGQFLITNSLDRAIRFSPTAPAINHTVNESVSPQLPVLVTIESASTHE
ncbi:environmental stress-induced protein Ves [Paraburkholderia sp. JPY465]|uniref:HutD/Ves family protein n=1 Tax=Paraburkholderia sp. JPY465 TaxID=3042285 RepID=UPI003D22152A